MSFKRVPGVLAALVLVCCPCSGSATSFAAPNFFKEGLHFYAAGDYSNAATSFKQSAKETAPGTEALLWSGFSYMAASQYDSAIAVFQGIPSASGVVYVKAQIGLGMALSAQRKFDQANSFLVQALNLNEKAFRSSGYYQLQKNFREAGEVAKSDESAGKLLLEFPNALESRMLAKELPASVPAAAQQQPFTKNGSFAIQVGAFGDRANAKRLLAELRIRYHHVEIMEKTGAGSKPVYAVLVGDFNGREKAQQFADEKLKERFTTYIIIEK